MERNDEFEMDSYATLDEYEIIPRPQELVKAQLHSMSLKEKLAKESALRKKLLQKKELLASKRKFLSKDEKKVTAKIKSRSLPHSATKEGQPQTEVTKSLKEDSEKVRPSPSKDDISKQELQLLKSMEGVAETAQERYDVLNARDNYLRLKESKKGESKVKKISGTCPDMCPEKERYNRIAKNCLAVFETKMAFDSMYSSKDVDHRYMVKEYSRSSADQQEPLSHELRPVSVLKFTMDYLVCNIIDRKFTNISIADWYDFIWNRTRSIRKDITQQQLCDVECVDILEKCARFHILCAELLSEEDSATFDPKINNENLTKCLQTLKHMYHDLQTKGIQCPNEAEFRAYDILLSLTEGETLRLVKDIRKEVFNSPPVKTAFEAALAFKSNNYIKFFKLMEKGTYLDCCILHRYIPEARARAMQIIERAYSMPNNATMLPLISLVKDLKFENSLDAANFCKWHGLTVDETHVTIQRQTFQKPSSVYPVARATSLVGNKLQTSLSEIINNGPLPENPLKWYQPHNSFGKEGLLLNKFDVSDAVEKEKEDIQDMDTDEVNVTTIPLEPIKISTSEDTRMEQEAYKLYQKNFSSSVTEVSSVSNFKKDHSFFRKSLSKIDEYSTNSKKVSNTSLSQEALYLSPFANQKSPPLTALETNEAENAFISSKLQAGPLGSYEASKTISIPQHSSSILNSSIPSIKDELIARKADFSTSLKLPEIHNDFIESEDSADQGIGSEVDMNEKTNEIEDLYCDNSNTKGTSFDEKQLDKDSLSLAMEDEETLKRLREEKVREIIIDISDEIYTECIESLSAEISESTLKEEWTKKVEYEDALEKRRAILARKAIYKWRLFCERIKQRRMLQNTEPLSPWIPMLMNTEYIASGACSPFSVYKKHCSLSRLADTKLKQRDNRPGWEPFTSSQFQMLNKLPNFPPTYLKKIGINKFFKLCIVFASYPNFSLSTFFDWMCKKFKLSSLPGVMDKKSNLLSFYTLNGGKTLMCIQGIVLKKNMDMKNIILNGLSAMMLCIPGRFPDFLTFDNTLEQYKFLLENNSHLLPFPLFAFLLGSAEKCNVNKLASFLDKRLYSGNIFSAVKKKEISNPTHYISNSNEVLGAVSWLIENQDEMPVALSSTLLNYLEDSFASVFSTLFWKLSLQEFKPLFQMPQQIILFYNKLLACRADLLHSNFLLAIAKWWPPQELFTLQPEYRFIDVKFQKKSTELMKNLHLPEFDGNPCFLKDVWNYVYKIADLAESGQEALFLSVQSILRISTDIDWPSIISKCAYFILCNFCTKFESCVNEDVFYMKPDLESINLDSFWENSLSILKRQTLFNKRKMPESEIEENSDLKKIRKKVKINVSDAISSRVNNLLSSLKSALKKQNEESDKFLLKLNESVFDQNCFSDKETDDRISDSQIPMVKVNRKSDSSDVLEKLLGKKHPSPITSPSSLSEKLLELKYNIQRNNILEDNLELLLKL
ncbi:Germinal-center associated nuclear protein like [Argiope bruennichi]|uniref:Germinal-center associated nuclear protein like n=1 Tax=Argiope bruennichi TaxID=94029 RepID=A0A8T0FX43_ARGBR|nr:Germinal-center associated nuclear protein like [Argiope bruennichi]